MKNEFDFKKAEKLILERKADKLTASEYTHLKTYSNKFKDYRFVKKRLAIEKYKDYDLTLKNTIPRV
ncbi:MULTISPECIES: hypothetical protein [Fusobacterium]|jgi:hypothetical protein|uniref:hypothetical protein n=1 Tax=Fusobacterium TaxID=848 RepID=UPI00201B16E5|nr:hypothetical protein [Fusobacterium nucleatum]MCL4584199.1 hypothetical protein [Fusobacterium nucleatum YWH7055]DAR23603.1 MAG TPA: hypothetical protein [Caudoviricetes sp.]